MAAPPAQLQCGAISRSFLQHGQVKGTSVSLLGHHVSVSQLLDEAELSPAAATTNWRWSEYFMAH